MTDARFTDDFWQKIIERQGAIPQGESLADLTEILLDYLRDTDPTRRDTYAYQILTAWILAERYTPDQLNQMVERWRSDLTHQLGNAGDTTVITRSFAALMLSIIVYADMQQSFLTDSDIYQLVNDGIYYLTNEQDLRGKHPEYGWLHATAHTADLLKFLARHPTTGEAHHNAIINAISERITTRTETVYTHSEPDRLAWIPLEVLKRQTLAKPAWALWLDGLTQVNQEAKTSDTGNADNNGQHGAYQNTKQFLRALYFRFLYADDEGIDHADELHTAIKNIHQQFMT